MLEPEPIALMALKILALVVACLRIA